MTLSPHFRYFFGKTINFEVCCVLMALVITNILVSVISTTSAHRLLDQSRRGIFDPGHPDKNLPRPAEGTLFD